MSTLAGGYLIQQGGYRWPYLLTAVLYATAAVLFWTWFGRRAGAAGPTPSGEEDAAAERGAGR